MQLSDVRFDRYYKYDEMMALLRAYSEHYPQLVSLACMGKSWEGRDVPVLTLTNAKTGCASSKPAMYIDANMHAGEVTGSTVALYTINYLLTRYALDESVTWLLDTRAFYIAPRVNPDGAEKYLTTPAMLRSSVRPYPEEDILSRPGLWPEDIDGDGRILTMRLRDDEGGEWKISSKDPRLMLPRGIDDRKGAFYRLYQEGFVQQFDGEPFEVNTTPYALDTNRNFPANWNPRATQGGPYPASEPEVRNIVEFVLAHQNIGVLEAYHTTGGIIFRSPYAYPDEQMDKEDFETMMRIVRRGTQITGYPDVSSHGQSTATIVDWAYEHRGIIGFCTELWDILGRAGVPKQRDYSRASYTDWDEFERTQLMLLKWNDTELCGEGFIDWYKFAHPQLGEVELGGWEPKYVRQNCPPKFLEQECHKNMMWSFARATALPEIHQKLLSKKRVSEECFRVEVLIENRGYLATNISNKAVELGVAGAVKATLVPGTNAELAGGNHTLQIGHLHGYRQAHNGSIWAPPRPAMSAARATWLVRALSLPAQIEVQVSSERAGSKCLCVLLE